MNVASGQVVQQSRWSDSHVYFTSRTSVPVDASMSESELQRRLVIRGYPYVRTRYGDAARTVEVTDGSRDDADKCAIGTVEFCEGISSEVGQPQVASAHCHCLDRFGKNEGCNEGCFSDEVIWRRLLGDQTRIASIFADLLIKSRTGPTYTGLLNSARAHLRDESLGRRLITSGIRVTRLRQTAAMIPF